MGREGPSKPRKGAGAPSRRWDRRRPATGGTPHAPASAIDAAPAGPGPGEAGPRDEYLPGGIRIAYEDADVVIVDKPPGLLTVRAPGVGPGAKSVFDELKAHVRHAAKRRGTRVWIVHRLDKEASGLLVFAKTEAAYEWLKEDFRARRVQRLYDAIVEGRVEGDAAWRTIQSALVEGPDGVVRGVGVEAPGAGRGPARRPGHRGQSRPFGATGRRAGQEHPGEPKFAVTHYRVLGAGAGRTHLELRLDTGRKHQIRAHLASIGHAIVGDRRYDASTDPLGRVCLHARELKLTHPVTGRAIHVVSPMPGSFRGLVGPGRVPGDAAPDAGASAPDEQSGAPPIGIAPSGVPDRAPVTSDAPGAPGREGAPSWDHVASWYQELIGERGSDHHERVIVPGTLRLLAASPGQAILDVACGQGILCRRLAALGVRAFGVDASSRLIGAARGMGGTGLEYAVADARELDRVPELAGRTFDGATCIMALMNMNPLEPVLRGIASRLAPAGPLVVVILHPAFRAPGQTSWGWDPPTPGSRAARPDRATRGRTPRDEARPDATPQRQYRRVDGYLSPYRREIVMNPGGAAHGKAPITTITFHRPLQAYVSAIANAGLVVDALEEWPSLRTSAPGPRASEENRARREFPLFMAIRARRA